MGRVYAIASTKGGVGKTTTTANLGVTLAAAGHRTVVVDADIGMPNLGRLLGVDPDGPTLHDVLAGEADPLDAVYEGPAGLHVVPGSTSLDAYAKADPRNLTRVLDALADYDVVLVDTGAGLNHDTLRPLTLADEVVLVSTPSPDAFGDTEKTKQLADRFDVPVTGLVLTRVDTDRVDAAALTADFEADLLAVVPEDPTIGNESGDDSPVRPDTDTPAAAVYRSLAGALGFGGDDATGGDDAAAATVEAAGEEDVVEAAGEEDVVEAAGEEDAATTSLLDESPDEVDDIDVSSLLEAGPEGVDDLDVSELFEDDSPALDSSPEPPESDADDSTLLEAAASEAGAEDVEADDTDADGTDVDSQDTGRGGLASALAEAEESVDRDGVEAEGSVETEAQDSDTHSDTVDDVPAVEEVVAEAEPGADDSDTDVTSEAPATSDDGVTLDSGETPDIPNAEDATADAAEVGDAGTDAPDDATTDVATETDTDTDTGTGTDAEGERGVDADTAGGDASASADDAETEDTDDSKGLFRRFFK
jgi:septum site-determining protein MinD